MTHKTTLQIEKPWRDSVVGGERRLAGFGEWLVVRGYIDRVQLFTALSLSFAESCRVGDALVRQGVMGRSLVEQEAAIFESFRTLAVAA
jgi:hypothetical protein